jgi:Serine/threonine protein kinase
MKISEFYRDDKYFYIVSEYCAGGDLFDKIKESTFNEKEAGIIMQQILSGINYLHKNGIVHR